jgi:predicted membrane protein
MLPIVISICIIIFAVILYLFTPYNIASYIIGILGILASTYAMFTDRKSNKVRQVQAKIKINGNVKDSDLIAFESNSHQDQIRAEVEVGKNVNRSRVKGISKTQE